MSRTTFLIISYVFGCALSALITHSVTHRLDMKREQLDFAATAAHLNSDLKWQMPGVCSSLLTGPTSTYALPPYVSHGASGKK